jgi:hypothetical protein
MEQNRPMEPGTEIPHTDFAIAEVQQGLAMGIEDVEAFDPRGMGEDLIKNAEFPQDDHAGRLEEKSRANGLAFVSPLEQDDFMALPAQEHGGRGPGGSAANDRDAEGFETHGKWGLPEPVMAGLHDIEAHQEIGGAMHDDTGTETFAPDAEDIC